jgi:hypothetical protein
MLFCERLVLTFAFAGARGMEPPKLDLSSFREDLIKQYIRYDIASGIHHAEQLIRDVERQGVELAAHKHL